jgi:hypothetical protein
MDFVRLGEPYTTNYVPDALIEGYSSLIFTERHRTPGEFELKTVDIEETMDLLPEDTLVSHLDTDAVMMVETHEITQNEEGHDELTVRGRSLESMTEHRWVEGPYQVKRLMRRNYSPVSAAAVLLYNSFDNASGKDVTRGKEQDLQLVGPYNPPATGSLEVNDYPWTLLDRIPNIAITDSAAADGTARRWWLDEGLLAPQLQAILDAGNLAIRVIRPTFDKTVQVVTVKATPIDERGVVVRTMATNSSSMLFDIYQGVDRRNTVSFSQLQGHLDQPQYLWSNREFKTGVEVKSGVAIGDVYRSTVEAGYSGIRRRIDEHDAGSPEYPPQPVRPPDLRKNATKAQKAKYADEMDDWNDRMEKWRLRRATILSDFQDDAKADALTILRGKRRTKMVIADVSSEAPYKFKTHYNLGDLVTLYGDYGQASTMVVSEYVRTEDINGERGLPGLTTP